MPPKHTRLHSLCLVVLTALCLAAPSARAWNGTGHMTVADIAYDNLTPTTKAAVDALLLRHKDYGRWMQMCPPGYADRARFAFMKAATWPDDIRKTDDDRPIWHFVDLPIVAPGYAADPALIQPLKPNALTQIPVELALLSDKKATDGDRAIGLCWVEHLVGDLHQPLHTASLYSALFPKGDRGGNSEALAVGDLAGDPIESAAHPSKLHALWDDLLGTTRDPVEIQRLAAGLEAPAFNRPSFPQLTTHKSVTDWAQESNALAKADGYLNGQLSMKAASENHINVALPAGYIATAHQVGNRQVALAGLRLADLLNAQIFPAPTAPPTASAAAAKPAAPAGGALSTDPNYGPIVGNKRSTIYHMPGDGRLPSESNRVYFKTEAEAQAAGYHKSGGQ